MAILSVVGSSGQIKHTCFLSQAHTFTILSFHRFIGSKNRMIATSELQAASDEFSHPCLIRDSISLRSCSALFLLAVQKNKFGPILSVVDHTRKKSAQWKSNMFNLVRWSDGPIKSAHRLLGETAHLYDHTIFWADEAMKRWNDKIVKVCAWLMKQVCLIWHDGPIKS